MKENDIRPKELMENYILLSEQDITTCFNSGVKVDFNCVACGHHHVRKEFDKCGFSYSTCKNCSTLFLTPRPEFSEFTHFYSNSKSAKYWAEVFFPAVAEKRRDTIFKPRVEKLMQLCQAANAEMKNVIEVGSGYGIFLEEWTKVNPDSEVIAIEPSENLAQECRNKGFKVIESMAEDVEGYDGHADLVVCFEVLEHVYEPLEFIKTLTKFVKPGGHLFISTLSASGFDIQTLWDKSNSISPPHHINFLSIEGFQMLFERAGLHSIEITTPGVLDVDIVKNKLLDLGPDFAVDKFTRTIVDDSELSKRFQTFLIENKLSSHAWVLGKK
ncbi:class I SAM-dependent methyltransferase [Vibrio sinaloensis]|uniref:class I SAM-dependent methyltransferase n=1 Tax=Photobacterium sp. (strain ATCC 43367) TaxID=379097 RepID=UPI002061CB64|nr:class I SAM-dependent methyltransferase [Vibrio sinaloensis]UPQ88108.1 class I SAM-dependent methyltransferase [Vibrio sinaloensis]